jgi:phosphoribosylanthranilate isomerase
MALRTSVKVGHITNLSDARYCAGMGVEMLGFSVIEGQYHYISPAHYQEIRGWFSGPRVVAELYGITSPEQLGPVLRDYQPDMLEISSDALDYVPATDLPLLIATTQAAYHQHQASLLAHRHRIAYVIFPEDTDENFIRALSETFPVLLTLNAEFTPHLLRLPIAGIVLEGSFEERPGLKDYALLADALETLEIDSF